MRKTAPFLCALVLVLSTWGCGSRAEAADGLPDMGETAVRETVQPGTDAPVNPGVKAHGPGETAGAAQAHREETETKGEMEMMIYISADGDTIVYRLNDSQAAKDLYAQLPLTLEVENFSTNEKVFYPPQKLHTANTPLADAEKGTLAYYEPWGDVVMFYDHFGRGSSLYELGEAVSGEDLIESLSGTIEIAAEPL